MARAASTLINDSPTPRSAKVLSVVISGSFSIGCAESRRMSAGSISTGWRDCRWAISIAAIRAVLAHESSESVLQPGKMAGAGEMKKRFTTLLAAESNSQRC